ncbi:MAG: MBL fold metallo-hydrolase [Clostridia bacterium]|nr:MBL fold metallo-hydrolase [Clostridia bacterium]
MELVKVGEKTYYIKNRTNIGIYQINETEVYLIDTGNDKEAGKKILKIIEEQGWQVRAIINTHSHADHIGGNQVIQEKTGCNIYAYGIEKAFIENPILEPIYLSGGYPSQILQENKFFMAQPSKVETIENHLPEGLEIFELKGHFIDMIGIKTSDDVYFLADGLMSEELIEKHKIFFLYDVQELLSTLNQLETIRGKWYIPSHAMASNDIQYLIQKNRAKVQEIIQLILKICEQPTTFEQILKEVFSQYQIEMNEYQHALIGSIIKCYLNYLREQNKIEVKFEDNQMKYFVVSMGTEIFDNRDKN